jgi:hypothetical protein
MSTTPGFLAPRTLGERPDYRRAQPDGDLARVRRLVFVVPSRSRDAPMLMLSSESGWRVLLSLAYHPRP